ncbi:MAG TPA: glycosyltransferase family 4 protein [Pyrinomonadaceae bacterium]|jgi:glycosyltransferase involved in cell wall biosynthesis
MLKLENLKICFIAGTLGQGGAERQLYYILRALRQSGASLRVLSLTRGEFWEQKIRELGIQVTCVGQRGSRLLRLSRIVAALREQPPDVLQSQHFYTNLYAVAAARALGLREVGAIRCDGTSEVRDNGVLAGYLSLRAPRVIAVNSRAAIRNAIKLGAQARRLCLLPNVVDVDQFKFVSRRERDTIRLLAVGRLVEQKKLDLFLNTVASLRQRSRKAIRASIFGDGPYRPQLERQANELGLLPDVVEFRGIVPDMVPIYNESDILVLTSDWEGTPNVVLEAMASGLAVVARRIGGVPEIIRHGQTGFLVDPTDEVALANSLLTLVNDSTLRTKMGQRAAEHVSANYSPRQLPSLLTEIYSGVLS